MVSFQRFNPANCLQQFIHSYWIVQANKAGETLDLIPDGYPELAIPFQGGNTLKVGRYPIEGFSGASLIGQLTERTRISLNKWDRIVSIFTNCTRINSLIFCLKMKKITLFIFLSLPFLAFSQLFTDASNQLPDNGAKGQSMDVRAADIDGDGDFDIILANEFQPNTILLNDGTGTFSNGTSGNLPQVVHDSEDVAIADFNNDGFLDLVFCSEDDVNLGTINVHEFYLGDGEGGFTTAAFLLPDSEANAVVSIDINNDTLPDLLFGNDGGTGVLINNGDGTFNIENDRVPQINRTTQDLALADIDNDGDLDLFEGNENGNLLHINDGLGEFTEESGLRLPQGLNIETRKVTFGDVDGDNDLDVFLSNVAFIPGKNRQNRLFLNNGEGIFSDATASNLPEDNDHTIDAIFEDVDLDGDLDLIVCNVFGGPIKLYENNGEGSFSNSTLDILGQNYFRDALGVIAEDFNGDGFRDIYICDRKTAQTNNKDVLLLRNPVTSVNEDVPEKQVTLFPNPVQDYFYLQTGEVLSDSLTISDAQGRTMAAVLPQLQQEGVYYCQVGNLPAGIYFVSIGSIRKKVIIAK